MYEIFILLISLILGLFTFILITRKIKISDEDLKNAFFKNEEKSSILSTIDLLKNDDTNTRVLAIEALKDIDIEKKPVVEKIRDISKIERENIEKRMNELSIKKYNILGILRDDDLDLVIYRINEEDKKHPKNISNQ
jgi:hypothetical protein